MILQLYLYPNRYGVVVLVGLMFATIICYIPYSGKVWRGESLANWLFSSIWWKKVWRINRSANRLSIVSTKLDGFSLANHGRFTKFANLPPPPPNFPTIWYMGLWPITKCHIIIITWALIVCLIHILSTLRPATLGLRVYISDKSLVLMLQLLHVAQVELSYWKAQYFHICQD